MKTMIKKYKVLLIGLGNMGVKNDAVGSGNEHKTISFMKALQENKKLFNIYVKDIDKEREADVAKTYHVSVADEESCQYDIVIITTPDEAHLENLKWVKDFVYPKPRLVICEKPLCMKYSDAKKIVKAYEVAGIPLLVDYTRRFIPEFRGLKKIHGKALKGVCVYNRGLEHTASHAIDLFSMFHIKPQDMKIIKSENEDERIWDLKIWFEDGHVFREQRIGNQKVNNRYNFHTRFVIENAVEFLRGKQLLMCSGRNALESLRILEGFSDGFQQS